MSACATAPPCLLCGAVGRTRRSRRGLCIACYRKLGECGIARPPPAAYGPPPRPLADRLRAWMDALAPDHRALLRAALAVAEGP